ncbi:MAG: ATP-binding cassette domain-containing protein [Bdellovibrionaceae bacterium]|nr:ATP-binding cassette domain-containing protein [Pseudobdellovibrionaceae bacterium]
MRSIQNFKAQVAQYQLVLSEISLQDGEITLLYGPSGSGKTSFLLGLLGVLPSEYKLNLNIHGAETDLGQIQGPQKNCGVVFQFENLFDHISVYRNLLLVKPLDESEASFRARIKGFGIEDLLDKKAHVLSGGEQQMVSCVRLFLQQDRHVLLLDEPWSAMDPENKKKYRQYLKAYVQAQNIPCLLVSHDEDEATHVQPRFRYDFNQVARFEKGQP